MDVKEFVAETLKQITEAVTDNSSTLDLGGRFNDALHKINIIPVTGGWATYIDFDIAVIESSSQEGGAKLRVVGVGGFGGDVSKGSETVSRVKFRVPIRLGGGR